MALLLFAARFVREETVSHLFQPKDGEVVAIKSTHNGKYFEVSPIDGKLYAPGAPPPLAKVTGVIVTARVSQSGRTAGGCFALLFLGPRGPFHEEKNAPHSAAPAA